MKENKLAIYVSSYDGCSDLWETFFTLTDRFWPDCKYQTYLINNEKEFTHGDVKVLHTGPEVHWFSRTIRSLKMIDEEYIMFMLEDYFISKKIQNRDIDDILTYMDNNRAFYYQLSIGNTKSKEPICVNVSAKTNYPVSLQPAIWKREVLVEILEKINGKTPWDVENYFIQQYRGKTEVIPGAFHDTRDLLGYKNGVLRGKWILDTVKYYKKLGIEIDTGTREVMSSSKMMKYRIAAFTNHHIPEPIKSLSKKVLKVFHFDYLK